MKLLPLSNRYKMKLAFFPERVKSPLEEMKELIEHAEYKEYLAKLRRKPKKKHLVKRLSKAYELKYFDYVGAYHNIGWYWMDAYAFVWARKDVPFMPRPKGYRG